MRITSKLADRASVVLTWGTSEAERARYLPCDDELPEAPVVMWRGVEVDAPAAVTFRWLCQLRVAPYSYDWLDNLGRRSPRRLTPGLGELRVGQRFMTAFELVALDPGRHVTIRTVGAWRRVFGDVAVTYVVDRLPHGRSRLIVKLRWRPLGPAGLGRRFAPGLAAGDFVMMRKQLLTLKRLAEESAHTAAVRGLVVRSRPWLLPPPKPPGIGA